MSLLHGVPSRRAKRARRGRPLAAREAGTDPNPRRPTPTPDAMRQRFAATPGTTRSAGARGTRPIGSTSWPALSDSTSAAAR